MSAYIEPIKTAVAFFPFVALLLTAPYMLAQYRRYGAVLLLRSAIVYSFVLYLMCAYFLVILPLPSRESVARLTSGTIQLVPFREVADLFSNPAFSWGVPSTWYRLFWSRGFFQIAANVLMLLPLGVYLRYYFGFGLKKTLLCAFFLSLFFELTQLSGLYFLYPRPYRLADVDDLITNTLGGLLGYWAAPIFMRFLPSKERMDSVAYRRGEQVSLTRRFFAGAVDGLLALILMFLILQLLVPNGPDSLGAGETMGWLALGYGLSLAIYYIGVPWLARGYTPGKALLRLRLLDTRSMKRPRLWQCAVRSTVLYGVVMPAPAWVVYVLFAVPPDGESIEWWMLLVSFILIAIYALFWLLVLVHVFTRSIQLLHDKLAMTRNVSTLGRDQMEKPQPPDAAY